MRMSNRRTLLLAAFLVFLLPPTLAAQEAGEDSSHDWQLPGRMGGASDQFEERLPASPQLALRFDGTPGAGIRAGAEASTRFVSEGLGCPLEAGIECEDTGLAPRPILSLAAQYHLVPEKAVSPYVLATGGVNFASTSRVLGVGAGAKAVRAVAGRSIYGELRYRRDDRFERIGHDHWEFMIGLDLGTW